MKIVLTGGGTLGSVTPLLAWWQHLAELDPKIEVAFLGTIAGPEKELINYYHLPYKGILAGKWRRYFSLLNLIAPLETIAGFFQAYFFFRKFKADVALGAGGFVSLPVMLAAKFNGVKVIIHQLDIRPTFTNKILSIIADRITVTFPESLDDFPRFKTRLIGSLVRQEARNAKRNQQKGEHVRLVVIWGGAGALRLNQLFVEAKNYLPAEWEIFHLVGRGKTVEGESNNYHPKELEFTSHYELLAAADLVISRAGLATLLELSFLAKPSIIIPLATSQQEDNAKYFYNKDAVVYLSETELDGFMLANKIKELIGDQERLSLLSKKIANVVEPVNNDLAVSVLEEILSAH